MTLRVAAGERLRIRPHLPHGMAGLWALGERDPGEYLSLQHSRVHLADATLRNGDALHSNRDRAMLTWLGGPMHAAKMAMQAACGDDGCGRHGHYQPGRCEDRFREAFGYGIFAPSRAPCPLNLVACDDGNDTNDHPAPSSDASILLRADIDLIVLVSAHPRDALSLEKFCGRTAPGERSPASSLATGTRSAHARYCD